MGCYERNLNELNKYHPRLFQEVTSSRVTSSHLEVLEAKTGEKTIRMRVTENGIERKVFLHSQYDPIAESRRFSEEKMKEQMPVNLLYGFGMGYHVQAMAELLHNDNKLIVFDTNVEVFRETLKHRDLSPILGNKNISLFISNEVGYLAKEISRVLNAEIRPNIITHVPSINVMGSNNEDLKFVMLELNLKKSINEKFLALMEENYNYNKINIQNNVGVFFNKFINIPIIIVCAGPSLDKNKHLLTELKNKAIIISVGKALKTLLSIKVVPNFIITIDSGEETFKQIEGLEALDIPFILLATAAKKNGENYQGPKFMACQYLNYLKSDEEHYLVKTGGSVSTTALDIAIKMGGNPIIYIGQDLAYTDNKHHCANSSHQSLDVNYLKNMRLVDGWSGTKVPTSLGMISFNRWIQNRAREERDNIFINATEGGAKIGGLIHLPFSEVIEKYLKEQFTYQDIINNIIISLKKEGHSD